MAFAFTVSATNGVIASQSGTDVGFASLATAINGVAAIARNAAYTVGTLRRPAVTDGNWYRCSTAGTTAATAPAYAVAPGATVTDGTAVFTALLAPVISVVGDASDYYMPAVEVRINGTLTNDNPSISTLTCARLYVTTTGNYTSGAFASDGVTPLHNGVHFSSVGSTVRTPDFGNSLGALEVWNGGRLTLIGGSYRTSAGIFYQNGAIVREYYVDTVCTRAYTTQSARIRSYSPDVVKRGCRHFDIAMDLFRMPLEYKTKTLGAEYALQYVGGATAAGAHSLFVASALSNIDGALDFDNWGSGWVELYNCAKGANLNVRCQGSAPARYVTPLFQQINFTITDLSGVPVQGARFRCVDAPVDSPTAPITTAGDLKVWDFTQPITYTGETNAAGVVSSSPCLQVWWGAANTKNLRFPNSTAVFRFAGFAYRQQDVQVVLGSDEAINRQVALVGATNITMTEAQAAAITGTSLVANGANSGTAAIPGTVSRAQLWHYWRWWKAQPENAGSDDTWEFDGSTLNAGAWDVVVEEGGVFTGNLSTTGTVTVNGAFVGAYRDANGLRPTVIGLDPNGFGVTWYLRHRLVGDEAWTYESGTGNQTTLLMADGTHEVQAWAKGYEKRITTLNTASSLTLDVALAFNPADDGTPQFTQPFNPALEAMFSYDPATMSVRVTNTSGTILSPGFAELYQATQRIMHLPELVWMWTNPIKTNSTSQKIIIPTGNPISLFLSEDSNASVKTTCTVVHEATGISADDRVRGNAAGYSIILGSSATAESAGIAAAVISVLGGSGFDTNEHSLKRLQEAASALQAKADTLPTLVEIEASEVLAREASVQTVIGLTA